jgi:hypothetical protein
MPFSIVWRGVLLLSRERHSARSGKSQAEAGEHSQVSMERDPLDTANAERGKAVLVLQAPELDSRGPWDRRDGQRVNRKTAGRLGEGQQICGYPKRVSLSHGALLALRRSTEFPGAELFPRGGPRHHT